MNRQFAARLSACCLVALCGGGAFAQNPAPKLDADPVLYVVRDSDTTIYLFGTAHLLPPNLDWFNDEVKRAFDDSQELYLEIIQPRDPSELAPLMSKLAIDPDGRKLSGQLDKQQRTIVSEGLREFGMRMEQIDPLEPWAAGIQVAALLAVSAGLDPETGAETVLEAQAEGQGKTIRAFETVEEQMTLLDGLPRDEQISSLVETLRDVDQAKKDLSDLIASWAEGDPDRTAALMNKGLEQTPETARMLLFDRNERWAVKISERMKQPGTVFVAVGAGHLDGKGGLNEKLAQRGSAPARVLD
jgi:uncharacterized protein YbaP (TraB family)